MVSDQFLCKRFQGGDQAAFEELCRRHAKLIGWRVSAFDVPSGMAKDDLYQIGRVALWRAAKHFRIGDFRAWAHEAIDNGLRDAIDAATTERNRPLNEAGIFSPDDGVWLNLPSGGRKKKVLPVEY